MKAKTVIKVKSDNFDDYFTFEAYCELRLHMSTGDFHTHTYEIVEVDPEETEIIDIEFNNDGEAEFVELHLIA